MGEPVPYRNKLPPFDELLKLWQGGMSYSDLAIKYGVGRATIPRKLRNGSRSRGLPWPLPDPEHQAKRTRGAHTQTVDALGVRLALQEYACTKTESWMDFSRRTGLNYTWLMDIRMGRKQRVRKPHAARILQAVGEAPHHSLSGWTPLVHNRSYGVKREAI